MKTTLSILAMSLMFFTSTAQATSCMIAKNPQAAFKGQVEAAIVSEGYEAVPRSSIKETNAGTVDATHDPEFDVKLSTGKVVHVTCDDSGDDDCQCQIAK